MGETNRRVMDHMRQNGGVLTRSTALALGMPASTLHDWVKVGHLIRVGNGLYVFPGMSDSERAMLRAATAALDAVVSHESAARQHGLDGVPQTRPTVSVPIRRSNRFADVLVHQLTDLQPSHTTTLSGMTVTTMARTIIDLAATRMSAKRLAAIVDQAVRIEGTTYEEIEELLEDLARKGKPGVKKLRMVLAPRLRSRHVSESTLESNLFDVIVNGGLPAPTTQYRPTWLRKVNGRVDLAYPEQEILIEGDSIGWHDNPEAFQLDRTRDNLAALAGWISLRYTWEDITQRPARIVAEVSAALSVRQRSGYPDPMH